MINDNNTFKSSFMLDASSYPQPRVAAMLTVENNLMPLSWHMPVSKSPFCYAVAIRKENYSHELVTKNREFALNFLNFTYFQTYEDCGNVHGQDVDKFARSGLTPKAPMFIKSTLIEESYMIYECRLKEVLNFGDHDIFIADVLGILNKKEGYHQPTLFLGKGRYETVTGNPITALRETNTQGVSHV